MPSKLLYRPKRGAARARQVVPCALRTVASSRAEQAGVTLIETLMCVGIAAIVTSLAIPSLTDHLTVARIKDTSMEVLSLHAQARVEAIRRGADVAVDIDGALFTVTAADGTRLLARHKPEGLSFVGGSAVAYDGIGRLVGEFTPMQIGSGMSSAVRCITIEKSGRGASKSEACPSK